MTPSELKEKVEAAGHDSHFFDRDTLRFFGDTMSNYSVRRAIVGGRDVYVLSRKRPVKHGNQADDYFDAQTFARCFP